MSEEAKPELSTKELHERAVSEYNRQIAIEKLHIEKTSADTLPEGSGSVERGDTGADSEHSEPTQDNEQPFVNDLGGPEGWEEDRGDYIPGSDKNVAANRLWPEH